MKVSNERSLTLQISGPAPAAAQALLKRLQEFACMPAPAGGPVEPPGLRLRLAGPDDPHLDPQGFRLTWNPGGDPTDMFDSCFTWHSEPGAVKISVPLDDPPRRGTLVGADAAGLLYGLAELRERCEVRGCLPSRPLEVRRAAEELQVSVELYRAYRDHAERGYEGISDVAPCYPVRLDAPLPQPSSAHSNHQQTPFP